MSVYYLQGQSTSGNTDGLFGYFYPLYTDESLINGRYHSHTFEGLNEVFYMPTGEMNHAAELPPADTSYGGLIYQKYATYNVSNTVISYTNISTEQTQTVIPIASNARDFARFGKLYKNFGRWNNEVLIDSSYVSMSISPRFKNSKQYGYSWWLDSYEDHKVFLMRGHLGQYVIVFPNKNLIVVRLGHLKGEDSIDHKTGDVHLYLNEAIKMTENIK